MLYSIPIGQAQAKTVAILHGILGSGLNWRSFCQRLLPIRPDLQFVLIDLRNHGRSPKFDSPNGLLECAQDVFDLQQQYGAFQAVVGHSFGGKVALKYAELCDHPSVEVWALDSNPSQLSDRKKIQTEASELITMLKSIPLPIGKRITLMNLLMEEGASRAVSQWMTTNLKRQSDGFYWRFGIEEVEEMINDYFRQDLWHILEDPTYNSHLVRALQSDRWSKSEVVRLEALPKGYHTIAAGHWIHSDNPEDLTVLLSNELLTE